MNRRYLIAVLLGALVLPLGCGYTSSSLLRDDIRTVYVEFFDNATFRREHEVALTKAVVEEIKLRTPLILAPRDEADSVLGGQIVDFEEQTHVKTETDEVLLTRARVKVQFRWLDRLTGAEIVPEQTVEEMAQVPAGAVGASAAGMPLPHVQRTSPGATEFGRLFEKAAQLIVDKMEENW